MNWESLNHMNSQHYVALAAIKLTVQTMLAQDSDSCAEMQVCASLLISSFHFYSRLKGFCESWNVLMLIFYITVVTVLLVTFEFLFFITILCEPFAYMKVYLVHAVPTKARRVRQECQSTSLWVLRTKPEPSEKSIPVRSAHPLFWKF